ncbi:hypothetical protein WUBG_00336, partial [Wuchereria bancrofti]
EVVLVQTVPVILAVSYQSLSPGRSPIPLDLSAFHFSLFVHPSSFNAFRLFGFAFKQRLHETRLLYILPIYIKFYLLLLISNLCQIINSK